MKKIIGSLLLSILFFIHANVQAENMYVEACSGANFLQTGSEGGVRYDFQTGYFIEGSLGYRWCNGLRIEAEYAYRRNNASRTHFFGRSFHVDGHFQSSSYMANLVWDLPLMNWGLQCWNIDPFIGAGIGYDCQQIDVHNEGLIFKETKKHFAWQVFLGLLYPIFCNTDLFVEYKFHQGGFTHFHNHSLGIGLRYNWNCN